MAKLPLQSQLGVIQPEQREAGLWRGSTFKQIGDQGGARWNPCGFKELVLLCIRDICTMIPYTVSFSVLYITIGAA